MKKTIFTFIICICLMQINYSQSGWFILNSSTNSWLQVLYFPNENIGFSSGWEGTYSTINGGNNWIPLTEIEGVGIFFLNNSTGFLQGQRFYKTTNCGINWTVQAYTDPYYTYYDVCFISETLGFRCGGLSFQIYNYSSIQKTNNGGLNWIDLQFHSGPFLRKILFLDSMTGFCTGGEIFYKTNTGGLNWSTYYPSTNISYSSMDFVNSLTGFLCGNKPRILKTTNGGVNFYDYNLNINDEFLSIFL